MTVEHLLPWRKAAKDAVAELWSDGTLRQVRAQTPSLDRLLHFDNAGASPAPTPVFTRMVEHLELEREIGGYAAARAADEEITSLYTSIATLIGADAAEIAFTENATRAWDMVFHGIAFRPGDRILTSRAEYASSYLSFMRLARKSGVTVEIVPDGPDGAVDVDCLRARLDGRVRLVNLCHAPTSNGLRNDALAVGEALRGHSALYFLDACQSIGQIDIDVRRIGCHALSATGRKFLRGPRGTGFLYLRADVLEQFEPPFIDIRSADWIARDRYAFRRDCRRFETWDSCVAGRLGLKAAIDYALTLGLPRIEQRVRALAGQLRAVLQRINGVRVRDRGRLRTGIVTFVVDGWDALQLRAALQREKVVLGAIELADARLDLEPDGGVSVMRAAVHYFNTTEEIERFGRLLAACAHSR